MPIPLLIPLVLAIVGVIVVGAAFLLRRTGRLNGEAGLSDDDDSGTSASSTSGKSDKKNENKAASNHHDIRAGYRYADERIFVHENGVYTGVKLNSVTDEQLSMEELQRQVLIATSALSELAGSEDREVIVRLTFRPIITEEWVEDCIGQAWDPTQMYKEYTQRIGASLDVSGTARPEVYLMVRIATAEKKGQEAIARRLDRAMTGVDTESLGSNIVAKWHNEAARAQQLLAFMGAEPMTKQDLMWLIRKPMHGHLTPPSVEYLAKRPWGPGDFALAATMNATNKRTHLVIDQVNDNPYSRDYELGEQVQSYTCFVAVSDWPEMQVFSQDTAWIRFLARLDLDERIEMVHRMKVQPPRDFAKKIRGMVKDINEELNDMDRAGREPDQSMLDFFEEAKLLASDIDKHKIPGVEGQILFQISAPTYRDMERIRTEFTQLMKNQLEVKVARPTSFQYRLLEMFLPGNRPSVATMPYVRMQEANVFGSGLPNTGTEVGDKPVRDKSGARLGWIGDYIGDTADGVPVHFSTHVGLSRNNGGGIATIGASGGGKSTLALIKFFLESESGVRTIALDPKVDFAQFCYYMSFGDQVVHPQFDREAREGLLGTPQSQFTPVNQQFWEDTLIIDVTKSQAGLLDCYQLEDDLADGEQLAETAFEMFLGQRDYEMCRHSLNSALRIVRVDYEERLSTAIKGGMSDKEALRKVRKPTMWQVVDEVVKMRDDAENDSTASYERRKDLATIADLLVRLRDAPVARLCFDANAQGFTGLGEQGKVYRRTVFTMRGLTLPKGSDPSRWGAVERRAAGVMHIITRYASKMLEVAREPNPITGRMAVRPKLLFVDEAYAVSATESGRTMLKTALAQGRSYNTAIWIIDQLAGRLAKIEDENSEEAGGNQLSTVFAYLHKTPAEARKALPLLGREGNPKTEMSLQPIKNGGDLETGRAIMKDVDSRVAVIEINVVFRELLAATDTNPKSREVRQANPISADPWDWTFMGEAEINDSIRSASALVDSGEADLIDAERDNDDDGAVSAERDDEQQQLVGAGTGSSPVSMGKGSEGSS